MSKPLARHIIGDLQLQSGNVLPNVTMAYGAWGTLAPDGRNAVLIEHGYTNGPSFVDTFAFGNGSWDQLIGPGKAIDTDRYFVICPNLLGSCHGSTSAASIDPATGHPYGSRFPDLTAVDLVTSQKALLDQLGIKHLVAVAGLSHGGILTFQWAVTYPDYMSAAIGVLCAPMEVVPIASGQLARLMRDPNWHGGDYYGRGTPVAALSRLRYQILKLYGLESILAEMMPDADAAKREAVVQQTADTWAAHFDANSLVILGKALSGVDLRPQFARIKARVLYVLSRTDPVFPPTLAPDVMARLKAAGVDAEYIEVDTIHSHYGAAFDAHKWSAQLRAFMDGLRG